MEKELNIEYIKDLTKDSFAYEESVNSFCIIKTIDDLLIIIYATRSQSIISFDLINEQKIKEIENAHDKPITNFRYHFDKTNKRDLTLSVSSFGNNLKLWDIRNWQCLLNIAPNNNPWIFSACFLNDNNKIFILTSNWWKSNSESIKAYDIKGNKIKEINDSNDGTFFIESYYDNKLSKNYILSGNLEYVKSYDYNNNKLYHKYCDNNQKGHRCIVIYNNEYKTNILESCINALRIWNFHSGILLNKIEIKVNIYDICMFNENNVLFGCEDKTIKLLNMENKIVIKSISGHNEKVITIKKNNSFKIWIMPNISRLL